MDIQQILRWVVIAIVLVVAVSLLGTILQIGAVLLKIGLRVLLILFLIAVVLRFFDLLRENRS